MTTSLPFTIHHSPLSTRYPFTINRERTTVNVWKIEKGKRLMASEGGS